MGSGSGGDAGLPALVDVCGGGAGLPAHVGV